MKTIIAGSRNATGNDVWSAMDECPWAVDSVVSGTAKGADKGGEEWAAMEGIPVERFPADWDKHGKKAGYIRNREMADHVGKEGGCVVVWDGVSKGSSNMIDLCKRAGIQLFVWYFKPAGEALYQIKAPHFVGAFTVVDYRVVDSAPILKWARGLHLDQVIEHCVNNAYEIHEV